MSFLKEQEHMSEEKLCSHVPKFGDRDNDDSPYTSTYFENARKGKSDERIPNVGKIMNPIDPGETPDKHRTSSARRQRNMGPESSSENSSGSVRTRMHSNHHRRTSSYPKNGPPEGSGSYEYKHHRTTSVPKFGEWDETDPTSGEGFTVIFNKVKEEKHAPQASNFETVAPEVKTMNYSDCHHRKCPTPSWGSKSKVCCCLF